MRDAQDAEDRFLRLDVVRTVRPGQMREVIQVSSLRSRPAMVEIRVDLASDFASMPSIRVGRSTRAVPFQLTDGDLVFGNADITGRVLSEGARVSADQDAGAALSWVVELEPGASTEFAWSVELSESDPALLAAPAPGLAVEPAVAAFARRGSDPRLAPWIRQSLSDLNGLRLALSSRPEDPFFAAGAPWYFTLFGRDSLWTSRLLLPVDVAQAGSTLRVLGRLAGTEVDIDSAEEPGKIPHELRRGTYTFGETSLPPIYYGTIDATPLWVCLLHDAWRAGLPEDEVRDLLPVLEGALLWMTRSGDADGDGFLEYIDRSGHGLANQGWKDSPDSVRFHDGRIAAGPVALCEVQGYAHEAAVGGATLLDRFGRPGGEGLRTWARALRERFRASFWCGEGAERYPALALDGDKQRVDSVTSNIGHLLGTGLLDAEEERLVAARVTGAELDSGLGLRTMSSSAGGYNPLSYHCGSVWPHDTAIVIAALERSGHGEAAAGLVAGLLEASAAFHGRLPELWSGEGSPVPYPSACRPQAWSAAAAVTVAAWLAER